MNIAEIQAMIALYNKAESKVLKNQSVSIGDKSLTRANLSEIRSGRKEWEGKLASAQAKAQGGSSLFSYADFS